MEAMDTTVSLTGVELIEFIFHFEPTGVFTRPSTRPCPWPVYFTRPRHSHAVTRAQKLEHAVYDIIMHLGSHSQDTRPCAKPCPPHG